MENPFADQFRDRINQREQQARQEALEREAEEQVKRKTAQARAQYNDLVTGVLQQLIDAMSPGAKLAGWSIRGSSKSIVGVGLTFDADHQPVGFVCSRSNRTLSADLTRPALIQALRELHSPSRKLPLMQQYDELVVRVLEELLPRAQRQIRDGLRVEGVTEALAKDPYIELLPHQPQHVGDWTLAYSTDGGYDGPSYLVTSFAVRLRLDDSGRPLCFECYRYYDTHPLQPRMIKASLSYRELRQAVKKLIAASEPPKKDVQSDRSVAANNSNSKPISPRGWLSRLLSD